MSRVEINVGVLLAHTPAVDPARLGEFAARVLEEAGPALDEATGAEWRFHREEPMRLEDDDPRRPSDFLDEASLRMAEGPYDLLVVVTDATLVSRKHRVVYGLPSRVSRVAILSTRKLVLTPRGEPTRTLEDPPVRRNGAALLLHLLGHILGAEPARDPEDAMAPFGFRERREVPRFASASRARLERAARALPERTYRDGNALGTLLFHLASAGANAGQIARTLLRNRAPLLPLSLPGLATAAVTPGFILVFTAEIWDVGLNLPARVAWSFAAVSILAAAWYLAGVQNLFFPRKEKRVVTEHMAVVNVTLFLTLLLASVGLFVMVGLLMMAIATWIFPPGLISTWPTLQDPVVTLQDKLRLAGFISTVGVLTGALAGGLESRTVIRHLALFGDEP
jgi:hypothetical protein